MGASIEWAGCRDVVTVGAEVAGLLERISELVRNWISLVAACSCVGHGQSADDSILASERLRGVERSKPRNRCHRGADALGVAERQVVGTIADQSLQVGRLVQRIQRLEHLHRERGIVRRVAGRGNRFDLFAEQRIEQLRHLIRGGD